MKNLADRIGLEKDLVLTLAFNFLALGAVNFSLFPYDPGFLTIAPNPYLLAVLVGAAQFGLAGGLWSALFTILVVVAQGSLARPASFGVGFSWTVYVPVAAPALIIALVAGEIREHSKKLISRLQDLRRKLEDENKRIKEQLLAVTQVKEELEQRILGQETTVHSLYKATKELETLEENQVYQGILKVTARFTGARKASLYVVDYSVDSAQRVAALGWEPDPRPPRFPLDHPIISRLLEQPEVLTIKDIRSTPELEAAWQQGEPRALVYVPIVAQGVVIALLTVEEIPFIKLNAPTIRILGMIADLAAPAITNVVKFAELQAKDQIDKLTDLRNAHYFRQAVDKELRRTIRHNLHLSILAFEISNLNQIENRFSAETRDLVVKVVGKLIQRNLREIDLVCAGPRRGSYYVMLPLTSLNDALKVAERVRRKVQNASKYFGSTDIQIDLVYGFSTYRPYVREADQLIQLAEQSLELAKKPAADPGASISQADRAKHVVSEVP